MCATLDAPGTDEKHRQHGHSFRTRARKFQPVRRNCVRRPAIRHSVFECDAPGHRRTQGLLWRLIDKHWAASDRAGAISSNPVWTATRMKCSWSRGQTLRFRPLRTTVDALQRRPRRRIQQPLDHRLCPLHQPDNMGAPSSRTLNHRARAASK
jgi:hypothetical protein